MQEIKLYPSWKQAVKTLLISGLSYGDTITRETIIELCEIAYPKTVEEKTRFDLQVLQATSAIKDALLTQNNMMLVTTRDGAYRVVMPKEQTAYAIRTGVKTIAKEFQRMALGVQHVNTAMLSPDERRKNADAQAKLTMLAGMHKTQHRELVNTAK